MAIRNSTIRNTNTVGVVVMGQGAVLSNNEIHHNGDPYASVERDTHGVLVLPGTRNSWVLGNHIHHNGGDAVQVGSTSAAEPLAEYVYVAGNHLHEDRENGVDIKAARHVVVSTNRIGGYVERSSSAGEAIVVHNNPSYVWILNNFVGASHQGIVCTGATIYGVMGNVIANVRGGSLSPSNLYSTSGILTYGSNYTFHLNNTISGSDAGISIGGSARTDVINNIVSGLTQATVPIRFSSGATRSASSVINNYTGANPGFIDPAKGDFRLKAPIALVDGGLQHQVEEAFYHLYGVALGVDLYGGRRIVGARIDVGAAEYQSPR
jgi:parallel beta-helix repeat protein